MLLLAGLALVMQVFGQAAPVPDECMVPTTASDGGHVLNVGPDQVFAVVLEANPTTGYSWSISTQPDASVAVALDSQMLPPASSLLGAPGRECFRFQSTGAGQTSMGFAYARPFEPNAPPAQTAEVQVTVVAAPPSPPPSPSPSPDVPVQLPSQ